MSSMESQYQTSLGLGAPFPKDFGGRARQRENRRGRGGSFFPRRRFAGRGVGRGQQGQQQPFMAGQPTGSDPIRGRGACYAFQAGTCRRGNTCRFSHFNQ